MISVSVSLDTVLLRMFVCLCFKSNLIWVWQEIKFYQLRISFQRKLSSVWLLLWWCSCPSVVQTVSPPVQWSHDLLTSTISSPGPRSLMVGKLKKYYFCHNSRLAAGRPEMDDIWPGVASNEILSCVRMVIALSLFLLSSTLRLRNCVSQCHLLV